MKHSDCKNFTPLDAFKGICRANGGMVMIDSDTCHKFAQAPKCRNCIHFCELRRLSGEISLRRDDRRGGTARRRPSPFFKKGERIHG